MHRSRCNVILGAFAVTAVACTAQAATWVVPDPSLGIVDIQDAVNLASSGDIIKVDPGTYPPFTYSPNGQGKAVTVIAPAGPDVTIIDGALSTGTDVTVVHAVNVGGRVASCEDHPQKVVQVAGTEFRIINNIHGDFMFSSILFYGSV